MTDQPRNEMSRRNLLGGLGVGAGAIGLTGISAAKAAVLPAPSTRESFDVVVIGTGLSGVAAALEAASRGARVAVLEKSAENRAGGNSLLAGGFVAIPQADSQQARDAYIDDFVAKSLGRGNREIYTLMAAHARTDVNWLIENKVEFSPSGDVAPFRVSNVVAAPGPYMGMPRALRALRDRIAEKGGKFYFETKARQLILNDRAAVSGVRAVGREGVMDLTATSVVIAAGGYAGNTQMLEGYANPNAGALMVRGITWATGDGLMMAQEAGAGLRGLGGMTSLHVAAVDTVETSAGNPFLALPYCLAVNRQGKRFIDESKGYVAHGKAVLNEPGQSATLIFDEKIKALPGPAASLATFTRLGIKTFEANSLEELARLVGVPEGALVSTVREFNAAITNEAVRTIQPPKAALAHRIDTPKFYAFHPLAPGITLSFGGIMINGRAQALEADGRVIAGLFAAGEGAGPVFFDDYISGGSLANCLVMGRIAGREAVA